MVKVNNTAALGLAAAAAWATAVAADAGTIGWNLGNKRSDGHTCKDEADYEADFAAMSEHTDGQTVRLYSAGDCDTAKLVLPVAKAAGFRVVLGLWVHDGTPEDKSFASDLAAAKTALSGDAGDSVFAVIVGSETLYRGNATASQLADRVADARRELGGAAERADGNALLFGTADTWNMFDDGTADDLLRARDGVDLVLINAFPYWRGVPFTNSTRSLFDDVSRALSHIQQTREKASLDPVRVVVGETGWPSDGKDYQAAKPSVEHAQRFFDQAVCGLVAWGLDVYVFEIFDEPGKAAAVGDDGSSAPEGHWGVLTVDRKPKWDGGPRCSSPRKGAGDADDK